MATGRQNSSFTLILLGISAIVFSVVFFSAGPEISSVVLEGKTAPDIRFELGNARSSLKARAGRVLLINFWASWCTPCMEEMPSLARLEKKLKPKGLDVLAFNIEDEPPTRSFLERADLPKNLVFDFTRESLAAYRVNAIPESVLIDKKGIVRHIYMGPVDWMQGGILKEIEALL